MKFSSKVKKCGLSPMRKFHPYAVAAEAKGRKIYHLNIGQPDVETPPQFFEAVRNFSQSVLEYAPSPGMPELIDAIQKYYDNLNMHFEKDEILITTGGSEALSIIFQCILDDGDEVLIPEPFYPNYATMVNTTGASIHPIPTSPEEGYRYADRAKIEAQINEHTRAIVCTNPGNPTGVVLTPDEQRHDLFFVVSRLHRVGVFPVDLQLLHDVVMVAGTGQAGFDAADLLMTHFHLKAVIVQDFDALFESSPNRSISTFPVLLLELLRCRELFSVRLIVRRSDPEFQFGRAGDADLFDIVRAFNAFHILKYIRMLPQKLHQVCFEFVDRISEDHARADRMLIVVDQERRNAQGADRQSRQSVDIVKVVVHIPVD